MRRRRKGTGTIERFTGGFRGRMPDEARTRLSTWATEEEAERELAAALAERDAGAVFLPGGDTLRAWGLRALDARELAGIRGIGTERSRWRTHVEPADFIDFALSAITPGLIRGWLAALLRKKAAPGHLQKTSTRRRISRQTAQNTLNLLRVVLQAAVDAELLAANPAEGVRLPRSDGATHEPWTYLEPHEQEHLLGGEGELEDLAAFALYTGMRQGEQWNLRLVDVHADHVVVRYGSKGKATKSGKLRRVPLFGLALEAVEHQRARLAGRPNHHGLLWPTERGARRPKGKAPRGWKAFLARAGIEAAQRHDGQAVRWHDLRHSCASSLVAGWWGRRWSMEEVRKLLGHSSITVTERYAHLADSTLADAARDTSTIRPTIKPSTQLTIGNRSAPPARIGLATFGLGRRSESQLQREVITLRGLIVDLSEHARAALQAIAGGGPSAWRVATEELGRILEAGAALSAETHDEKNKLA